MKRFKKLSAFIIFVLALIVASCEHQYSYAQISVTNKWSQNIRYKVGFLNEIYNDNTADTNRNKSINIIYPNKSPIAPEEGDTVELNWGNSQNFVKAKVFWGKDSVYDNSTDYFKINDGEHLEVDLSVDITISPKKYVVKKR